MDNFLGGDCWSLERTTSWCNPGFQNDAPREQPLGRLSEQVRIGSALSGLFTLGLIDFEWICGERNRALTFTCAQQEPVDFGPFLVGAVVGEDESRPFFEAFHFNPKPARFSRSKDSLNPKLSFRKL